MGRLHHLREVTPRNLEVLSAFKLEPVQWVIVNYGNEPEMDEWAREILSPHIVSGLVKYVRMVKRPSWYISAHAKNVSYVHADGRVVANLDGDTLIHEKWLTHLHGIDSPNMVMSPRADFLVGMFGCYKSAWSAVGGYNERMVFGWGADDADLLWRVAYRRPGAFHVRRECLLERIPHENVERNLFSPVKRIMDSLKVNWNIACAEKSYIVNGGHFGEGDVSINFE